MVAASGGPVAMTVQSVTSRSAATCTQIYCSRYEIEVNTPAVNPDGDASGSTVTLELTASSLTMSVSFVYDAAGEPIIELVEPAAIPLLDASSQE
eukprot:1113065-Rhodomonas_salina.1